MSTHQIQHQVGIKATPEAVYKALTDLKQLARWWTSDTRGKSEVGSRLEFWFGNFFQKFEVIELKPQEQVRWKATKEGVDEWAGTEIGFRLKPDDNQTLVRFTHSNWSDDTDFLAHCSTKWAVFLLSLKDLLEKGKGHPFPEDLPIKHG
ncbi:MAG: SRPBCC domain-containing protein [Betaproteobacteria bacterium]|nr:SRPBCC domain-containing protein [Betaproteobacteria bacterium]